MSSSRSTWLREHFRRREVDLADAGGAERGVEPELRLAQSGNGRCEIARTERKLRDAPLWLLYKGRYIDPKTALRQSLIEQVEWYHKRAEQLGVFGFSLNSDPDAFKRQVLLSRLDPLNREWAMKLLTRCASEKATECRQNAEQLARWAGQVEDKVFFYSETAGSASV